MASHIATNRNPDDGDVEVPRNTTIEFTAPNESNEDLITVTLVEDGGGAIPVITNGVDQTGYSSTITPNGSDLDVVITPADRFDAGTVVDVHVETPVDSYDNTDALMFTQQRILVFPNFTALQGVTSFTCTFWYKTPNITTGRTFISSRTGGAANSRFQVTNPTNGLGRGIRVNVSDGTNTLQYIVDNTGVAANTWQHYMILYDGGAGTVTVYLNNTAVATNAGTTGTCPTSIGTFDDLGVGANVLTVSTDVVRIDHLAFWDNYLFDATERAECYNSALTQDLMDDTHAFPDPNVWFEFNNTYDDSGTDQTDSGSWIGAGGTLGTNYGFETTDVVAGQAAGNLDDTWTFTIKRKAAAQVAIIT